MKSLYQQDLAYIRATALGDLARDAAPEIVRLLKSAAIDIRRVVDVGCGAGPLTKALVEDGFHVTGIEPSAELLAIAQAVAPTAQIVNASIYDTVIPACEAIVAIGESLTYHADDTNADGLLRQFFRRVSDTLPHEGSSSTSSNSASLPRSAVSGVRATTGLSWLKPQRIRVRGG